MDDELDNIEFREIEVDDISELFAEDCEVDVILEMNVVDLPEFNELIENIREGAIRIRDESKDEGAKFWAGRIINRLEAFCGSENDHKTTEG